jgi:Holliday junction resolvasome RuvABC endonuclease subunit
MIVAVDAASRTGLAVLDPATSLAWVASGRYAHGPTAQAVLAGATHVAVEAPYVSPRNPSSGLKVAKAAGVWEDVARSLGAAVVSVSAQKWRRPLGCATMPRAKAKAAVVRRMHTVYGVHLDEDQADALGLLLWLCASIGVAAPVSVTVRHL